MQNYWLKLRLHGENFTNQNEITSHLIKKDFGYDVEHTTYKNHNRLYLTRNGKRLVKLNKPDFTVRQFNLTGSYVHVTYVDSMFALSKWKFPERQTNAHFAMKEIYEKLLETLDHNQEIIKEFYPQL